MSSEDLMTENETTKSLLAQLAEHLDKPDGPGGGAICLDALAAIEDLERRCLPPARPPDSES